MENTRTLRTRKKTTDKDTPDKAAETKEKYKPADTKGKGGKKHKTTPAAKGQTASKKPKHDKPAPTKGKSGNKNRSSSRAKKLPPKIVQEEDRVSGDESHDDNERVTFSEEDDNKNRSFFDADIW